MARPNHRKQNSMTLRPKDQEMGFQESEIRLPGINTLGLTPTEQNALFPNALRESCYGELHTQREYAMVDIMSNITDKENWDEKVFNKEIIQKWRAELKGPSKEELIIKMTNKPTAAEQAEKNKDNDGDSKGDEKADEPEDKEDEEDEISEKMMDWCIAELQYKARLFKEINCVEGPDGIFKSDTIIPNELREALIQTAAPLENIPERSKDWHPGSNEQVLDLVHPSLYPLVYGQSKILVDKVLSLDDCLGRCGDGETLPRPSIIEPQGAETYESMIPGAWSTRFQWLPSDFAVPLGVNDVKIMSYINNLHPHAHKDLYSVVEQIVSKAIPVWNHTLSPLKARYKVPIRVQMKGYGYEGYEDDWHEPEMEEDEDEDDYEDRLGAWKESRRIIQPEPEEFKPPMERLHALYENLKPEDTPLVDLRKDFGKLQIIVKLANIHLTPENPTYPGGSWHIEGQLNENICATALYYYDTENIIGSALSFRQQTDPNPVLTYPQDDHRAVETIFNIDAEGSSIQNLGDVATREGRLLAFPNIFQHCVSEFRLADPSKPGHRKILALFLIDPHYRIISTANIPCQQKSWWADQIRESGTLGCLPPELVDQVLDYEVDFPISLEASKAQRLELMAERSVLVGEQNDRYENTCRFYLCEH